MTEYFLLYKQTHLKSEVQTSHIFGWVKIPISSSSIFIDTVLKLITLIYDTSSVPNKKFQAIHLASPVQRGFILKNNLNINTSIPHPDNPKKQDINFNFYARTPPLFQCINYKSHATCCIYTAYNKHTPDEITKKPGTVMYLAIK